MKILNNFARNPTLWKLFESVFGADKQKRIIYRKAFEDIKSKGLPNKYRLLDFGCSIGNTTKAFLDFDYYGLDIDDVAISYAKRMWSKFPNVKFYSEDILNRPFDNKFFDFILFSGTGHHLSDEELIKIIGVMYDLVKKSGEIWFFDILKPVKDSPVLTKFLAFIDRGKNIRSFKGHMRIFNKLDSFKIIEKKIIDVENTLIPQEDYCFFRLKKNSRLQ